MVLFLACNPDFWGSAAEAKEVRAEETYSRRVQHAKMKYDSEKFCAVTSLLGIAHQCTFTGACKAVLCCANKGFGTGHRINAVAIVDKASCQPRLCHVSDQHLLPCYQ